MRTLQPLSFFVSSVFVLVVGFTVGLGALTAKAGTYNLTVDRVEIDTGSFKKTGIGYNGASPGPVLRFDEGEDVKM